MSHVALGTAASRRASSLPTRAVLLSGSTHSRTPGFSTGSAPRRGRHDPRDDQREEDRSKNHGANAKLRAARWDSRAVKGDGL